MLFGADEEEHYAEEEHESLRSKKRRSEVMHELECSYRLGRGLFFKCYRFVIYTAHNSSFPNDS